MATTAIETTTNMTAYKLDTNRDLFHANQRVKNFRQHPNL